ncbi:hypothetical protein [Streptomyces sp. NPDC088847]|uniref:hypothetical protein n=1 Tax=Streptomyces sp. NPDC088847 TaxID=3365909 RepID=UPI0038209449
MTAQIMTRPRPTAAGPDDDASRRLGQHLLDVVRRQDAAIPADRRVPRTVAEMRARLEAAGAAQDDVCPMCERWRCRCGEQSAAVARAAGGTVTT